MTTMSWIEILSLNQNTTLVDDEMEATAATATAAITA